MKAAAVKAKAVVSDGGVNFAHTELDFFLKLSLLLN